MSFVDCFGLCLIFYCLLFPLACAYTLFFPERCPSCKVKMKQELIGLDVIKSVCPCCGRVDFDAR